MERTTAFIMALFLATFLGLVSLGTWYSHNEDETFVRQCNIAGGTAAIADTNKCYKGDHLLYTDESQR